MAFSVHHHVKIVWLNFSFFIAYIVLKKSAFFQDHYAVLTDNVKSINQYSHDEKMNMLSNSSDEISSNVSSTAVILHFAYVHIPITSFFIMLGIITAFYSLLSWTVIREYENDMSNYDSSQVGSEKHLGAMEFFFWIFLFIANITLYVIFLKICPMNALSEYAALKLILSW